MDEKKPEESLDESLQNVPPMPVEETDKESAIGIPLNLTFILAGGFAAFSLASVLLTPAVGSTRSARLQWEQRREQIEEAAKEAETNDQPDLQSDQSQ